MTDRILARKIQRHLQKFQLCNRPLQTPPVAAMMVAGDCPLNAVRVAIVAEFRQESCESEGT